jgi:hypothetical protein
MSKDDYDIGYGRPPKHTQFVAGESGNKGRKKKRPEFQAEMVARVRDEQVIVNGRSMTMFEVAVRSVMNSTVKRGHPRDLKALFDLLEKYGAIPKGEAAAESKAAAESVMERIMDVFNRTNDVDPEDVAAIARLQAEEAAIVMNCPSCSPPLRKRWNLPERKALGERYGCSGLQRDVEELKKING